MGYPAGKQDKGKGARGISKAFAFLTHPPAVSRGGVWAAFQMQ